MAVKQVRCPVLCWFFKCFVSNITGMLNPAELAFENDKIANASKYLTKCGISHQPYIPMFITLSRKKGGEKGYILHPFEKSVMEENPSLPPHPCFPVGILSSCSHYPHKCADTACPLSWDSRSRCMPEAEDNAWATARYLCKDPSSPAKMHLRTSFKQEETKDLPPRHKSPTAFKWRSCPSGLADRNKLQTMLPTLQLGSSV